MFMGLWPGGEFEIFVVKIWVLKLPKTTSLFLAHHLSHSFFSFSSMAQAIISSVACDKCGNVNERQHPTPPQEIAEQTQVKTSSVACDKCGSVHENGNNVKKCRT